MAKANGGMACGDVAEGPRAQAASQTGACNEGVSEKVAATASAPAVSIVMPVHNAEAHVGHMVECLQAQTFTDWELIAVDDASNDGSRAVIERFARTDARIRPLALDANVGVSEARNRGLAQARGRWVWFADADDAVDEWFLAYACEALSARNEAGECAQMAVFGVVEEFYDASGTLAQRTTLLPEARVCGTPEELRACVLPLEQQTLFGYCHNKVYERELLHDLQFRSMRLNEDFDFNARLVGRVERAVLCPKAAYHYARRAAGSLSQGQMRDYFALHKARVATVLGLLEGWGLADEAAESALGALLGRYLLSALERNCAAEAHLGHKARRESCATLLADPLVVRLLPHAQAATGPLLDLCLDVLKSGNITRCLALARCLHLAKTKGARLFNRLKHAA